MTHEYDEEYSGHDHTDLEPCGHFECCGVECPICLDGGYIDLNTRRTPCPVCRPDDHDDTERAVLVHLAERQVTATYTEEHDDVYGWFGPNGLGWEAA